VLNSLLLLLLLHTVLLLRQLQLVLVLVLLLLLLLLLGLTASSCAGVAACPAVKTETRWPQHKWLASVARCCILKNIHQRGCWELQNLEVRVLLLMCWCCWGWCCCCRGGGAEGLP
jgi:hypothetical protein